MPLAFTQEDFLVNIVFIASNRGISNVFFGKFIRMCPTDLFDLQKLLPNCSHEDLKVCFQIPQ